ncbi:long polar fimbrial protein LpfD [Salmonella sp. NCTC 11881]|nr:long polar fimbrial protein LpfD [Salmonella sp. NCTC 11881]
MLKKLIMFTGLLGGSVLFSGQALAAADFGPCTPEGGTHIFSATINKNSFRYVKEHNGCDLRRFR